MLRKKLVIIGAGPTGLGAAYRLRELGEMDFLVLERNNYVGGLAASFQDAHGFTWDIGGHVLFSHYEYFDRLLDNLLGEEFLEHQREAWIRVAGTWVPYPFQNNIRYLPKELQWACVDGLLNGTNGQPPENFKKWLETVFGVGIANLFMLPYNFKVWAHPLEMLDFHWISKRISVIDLKTVLRDIILDRDNVAWGPNRKFRFPLQGGTGEIFRRLAQVIDEKIMLGQEVLEIDPQKKRLRTEQNLELQYDFLLNTSPLDKLLLDCIKPEHASLMKAAQSLKHNGVYVAGTGIKGTKQDRKSWMYFPETDCPFYRVTNFHNYSPLNTSHPGEERALMAEVSFSPYKSEDLTTLMEKTLRGLEKVTLLEAAEREDILSTWQISVDYGYPIPCQERNQALSRLMPYLEAHDIYSRGRFGGWKYEVGNMDHSLMQGVEWAERMVWGTKERTYNDS